MRLQGGFKQKVFCLFDCSIETSGQLSFSNAREILSGEPGTGGGYDINIMKPGGEFEIRFGETPDNEVRIAFQNGEAQPIVPTRDILDAFNRWKESPSVRSETITQSDALNRVSYVIKYTE